MKKNLLSIVCGAMTAATFAQIPNNSFENWTTVGSYKIPNNWGTMNNTTASYSVATATQGTPGNPGSFYLKLTSLTTGSVVTNGIAVSGKLDTLTMQPVSGFPCTLQPVSITGRWQHMIFGSSQGSVKAVLTKWNSTFNKRDTMAIAAQTLTGMAMNWTNFFINFTYLNSATPDSCIIELRASGSAPAANDYLWIDNLAFSGSVTGLVNESSFLNSVAIFPNPASENVTLELNLNSPQNVSFQIKDIAGKIMLTKNAGRLNGQTKQTLNLSGLTKGAYFISIIGESKTEVRKIVIE